MATLRYEYPIAFNATPLKHKSHKFVAGKFIETYDVAEVDANDVHPLIDITNDKGEEFRCFEIEGRFYRLVGAIDDDVVAAYYSAANSPIKALSEEYHGLRKGGQKRAKSLGLPIFPKLDPEVEIGDAILKREWFSELDREWLDRIRDKAVAQLSSLRSCDGVLYERMSEPGFIVTMSASRDGLSAEKISIAFEKTDNRFYYIGHPVGYFTAAQQAEAWEYAVKLAQVHGAQFEFRGNTSVVVHDEDRLTFEPSHAHAMDACTIAYRMLDGDTAREQSGLKDLLERMEALLGETPDDWRSEPNSEALQSKALAAGELAREAREFVARMEGYPVIFIDTLLERWDDRPVALAMSAAPSPRRV
ncbi:hypothetical protein [Rhizobium sp. BK176]|uniref:hypothetical protein n=1 Tax=Rhizobium sp. BK176 TaxID=2587071 RepID=UPI002168A018|nr:hypothetical protein [Rhizobium sp. BK176]MCS4089255.1 hypothetical protein [Rhizobium sp. BK176]